MAVEAAPSCLGFGVDCGVLFKGAGVVLAGFILFISSVYVLLSAIFGRWMGYLVLVVCFSGWLIVQSSLWAFGFWSQGPDTVTNLGPRGHEPAWLVVNAGVAPGGGDRFAEFDRYPDGFTTPDTTDATQSEEVQAAQGAATAYLSAQANTDLGLDPFAIDAVTPSQFSVDKTFVGKAADGTPLMVVEAHYTPGGPETVLSMYFDTGNVPVYSYLFLAAAILLFAIHLPLLDRAEKKRKAFLTGGAQPAWFGPA
jgi:hypothetical protein